MPRNGQVSWNIIDGVLFNYSSYRCYSNQWKPCLLGGQRRIHNWKSHSNQKLWWQGLLFRARQPLGDCRFQRSAPLGPEGRTSNWQYRSSRSSVYNGPLWSNASWSTLPLYRKQYRLEAIDYFSRRQEKGHNQFRICSSTYVALPQVNA